MTTPQIELTREALHRLLKPVALFTSSEAIVPIIGCVLIEGRGNNARAIATDRFSAAVSKTEALRVDEDFRALIHRDDVKQLLSLMKKTGSDSQLPVTLSVDGEQLTASSFGVSATFLLHDVTAYPTSITKLCCSALTDEPAASETAFDPALIGRLKEAATAYGKGAKQVKVRMGSTRRKPMVATIGEDFLGVFMPRISPDYVHPEIDAWLAELSA